MKSNCFSIYSSLREAASTIAPVGAAERRSSADAFVSACARVHVGPASSVLLSMSRAMTRGARRGPKDKQGAGWRPPAGTQSRVRGGRGGRGVVCPDNPSGPLIHYRPYRSKKVCGKSMWCICPPLPPPLSPPLPPTPEARQTLPPLAANSKHCYLEGDAFPSAAPLEWTLHHLQEHKPVHTDNWVTLPQSVWIHTQTQRHKYDVSHHRLWAFSTRGDVCISWSLAAGEPLWRSLQWLSDETLSVGSEKKSKKRERNVLVQVRITQCYFNYI